MSLTHVMIDLETLGTVPGCVILSIGAVAFDPATGNLGQEFYNVVNTASCEEHYLAVSEKTMDWWRGQPAEARAVVDQAAIGGEPLANALGLLNGWLQSLALAKELRLYGNGADFDNPILRVAYDAAHVEPYASGYGGRCYRTLKNLDELFGDAFKFDKLDKGRDRQGVHHNALDDAKSQALHLMRNIARIRGAFFGDAFHEGDTQ